MKKIGLYVPNLSNGGAERVVSRLSYILSNYYEVFIILNEDVVNYDVFCKIINLDIPAQSNLFKKVFLPFRRAKRLKKIKQTHKMEVVISFLTNANIVNALSITQNTSTILSVRNFSELEKNQSNLSKVKDIIMKLLYQRADCVVPVSLALEKSLIENYNIPRHKIKTIYNPYDIDEINALSKTTIESIEHKHFLNTGKVFITVGRLTYQKGHWHLLKAFSMLPDDCQAKLLIIGTGENQSKIERLIKTLNIEGKVLLAGYQKNPFQYISKCYAYVLTSLFEGFPNAMVEAMACQCPVIAADCKSGPREILFEGGDLNKEIKQIECADYGILVPKLSMEDNWSEELENDSDRLLSKAMKMMIDNEALRNELGKKGQKRARLFNYQVCLERYIKGIENARSKY